MDGNGEPPAGRGRAGRRGSSGRRGVGSRIVSAYAAGVVRGRWFVIVGWILIAGAATIFLPSEQSSSGGSLGGLVSADSQPVQAELASATQFGFPLLAREAVVQRNPKGLSVDAIATSVASALAVDLRTAIDGVHSGGKPQVVGVLPVLNAGELGSAAGERGTTIVNYLFTTPTSLGYGQRTQLTQQYAQRLGSHASVVGITGIVPGRVQQGDLIEANLRTLEIATVALIALIVAFVFRSVVAPLITLGSAIIGYLVAIRALGELNQLAHLSLPQELSPLIIALLLGVTTDYSVFYLNALRKELREGLTRRDAVRAATSRQTPIILAAGITVTGGTLSLLVADYQIFRVFGPGLAVTVVVALLVSVSLIPAALAVCGERIFWPSHPSRSSTSRSSHEAPTTMPTAGAHPVGAVASAATDPAGRAGTDDASAGGGPRQLRDRIVAQLVRRRVAAVAVTGVIGVLVVAIIPLSGLHLDMSITRSLPAGNPVTVANDAASAGFTPGIVSPTIVVAEAAGITSKAEGLDRFQRSLARQPGVAAVLGPRDAFGASNLGIFETTGGDAARYFVVLDADPLGAVAVDDVRTVQQRMPALLKEAGLTSATASVAGDTAIAVTVADKTKANLMRIAIAAIVIELLLLIIFLRALVAPLYLMLTSVLVVAAALGLTVFVFQHLLGHSGLTFYVPFASAVLLLALGSDYNVFGVGRIWAAAREHSLPDAIRIAVPGTTRAINTAGVALAGSFGLVALIPLDPFRELAFTMVVGLLIDTFLVRFLLVPGLIVLVGPASGWPGRALARSPR